MRLHPMGSLPFDLTGQKMNPCLLTQNLSQIHHQESIQALESGQVLFFPQHYYSSMDSCFMSESILAEGHKNLSYDIRNNKLGAFNQEVLGPNEETLRQCMRAYANFAHELIQVVIPSYIPHLLWGRTSFRPAQISGRPTSKRKDDRRLHVDSFSATPVYGLRILRVFCNINPQQEPRVWHIGESFPQVLDRFAPQIPAYKPWLARILHWIKSTKTLRSAYDHYMLNLHDRMKGDDLYQEQVQKTKVQFPSYSTWIVFTDQVSHAALSGQYLLEQTFYLPVESMQNPELSPWVLWKKFRPELGARIKEKESHFFPIQTD